MNVPRIAASRVRALNPCDTVTGDYVLYWMQQSQRAVGNDALEYAVDWRTSWAGRLSLVSG
jgi:hypothetical protein